jgi:Uma2 family endonuclease
MNIVIENPPRTIMEVYEMLPEGTLAELIDNQIYMSPAPLFKHQWTIQSIFIELNKIVQNTGTGSIVLAPFDIKLDPDRNSVQPDIVVILNSNPNQISAEGRYAGVPDLLIEVLSPGNREQDLVTKKDLYEKFGVQEYWVVDPETNLALGFALKDKRYIKISEEIGKIASELLNANFNF